MKDEVPEIVLLVNSLAICDNINIRKSVSELSLKLFNDLHKFAFGNDSKIPS